MGKLRFYAYGNEKAGAGSILKEQTCSPKLTKDQILFVLDKFCKLDFTLERNRERLIDGLVKCVLLYDDKLVIILNYKNELITVSTSDELDEVEKISDTEAFASPNKTYPNYFVHIECFGFVFYI